MADSLVRRATTLKFSKGEKRRIKAAALRVGENFTDYVRTAIKQRMAREEEWFLRNGEDLIEEDDPHGE